MAGRPHALFLILCLGLLVTAGEAPAQEKPTLTPADYDRWEFLGAAAYSPDAAWVAYSLSRVDTSRELRVRAVSAESEERVFEWGQRPEFSEDSRWVAWTIGVDPKHAEQLRAEQKPVHNGLGVLELGADDEQSHDGVASWSFDATGGYLAALGYAPDEPRGKGADLRVLDLDAGTSISFGNVSSYSWSDAGSMLAFVVATGGDEGNGVQLYDLGDGTLQALDSSGSAYRGLAWREDAADLAVYRSGAAAGDDAPAHDVLAWRGLDGGATSVVVAANGDSVPDGMEIVAHRSLEWSDDGSRLAIGLRPVEEPDEAATEAAEGESAEPEAESDPEAEPEAGTEGESESKTVDEPELPGLQIWHTSDVRLFPAQRISEQRDSRRTLLAVLNLDTDTIVAIGSDLMERAELVQGWSHGIERVAGPYPWGTMFGRPYHDVWVIDAATGERVLSHERVRYSYTGAGGNYLLTFDGDDYESYRLADGVRTNLTADLDVEFQNADYDTPTDMLPPFGVGGWLSDDEAVLLYDEFDVWRVAPDGSGAERVTSGRDAETIHRLARVDPEAGFFSNDPLDPDDATFFSLRNELTEARGYAVLDAGTAQTRELVLADKLYSGLVRIGETDRYAYRVQARDDSPDLFVSDADLANSQQLTATNAFQDEYAWTRSELVNFESETGRPLQAALLYPAGYDPTKRYPMIVYTYEILAPQIHTYQVPSERSYYNFTAWTQQGYFVLLPDIVYTWREPGPSAIASVRAAVTAVVDRELVDADRVGLIGHSWGGYQAAYLPTRIDTFAASVAGAPLTDFVSFMGQLHWNQGAAELGHWETGQGRMEVPYWEDPEAHHRSSPIHKVHEMHAPLLMAFGDEDGVVDWDQGTEFYNFARRAGKQMILLVYEGEDHGFREEANQKDYHRRILEWFGHYLKGDPAPAWITDGVPYEDLEEEKRRVATSGADQR